jgi:hypothetical protein
MKKILLYFLSIMTVVGFFSCEDYLTEKPATYIPAENAFEKADDALGAVAGIYALMQPLVDQIFLYGEAQGDLVVAARGADKYIAEIAQNRVTPQNPYTDYTNFYKVIVACHNTMEGLANIRKLDPVNYVQQMYELNMAEIIYVRSWTYLQLVKMWEDVPYLGYGELSIDRMNETAPSTGETILRNILKDVIDHFPQISRLRLPSSASAAAVVESRAQFTQQAALFLRCEIYLYLNDLINAWETIRPILPYGEGQYSNNFGITSNLGSRYWDQKISGITDLGALTPEWVLYLDFDGSKGQTNNLQRWTDNVNGGIYALKPSSNSIRRWSDTPMYLFEYQRQMWYFDPNPPGQLNRVADADGNLVIGHTGDMYRGQGTSYEVSSSDTIIFKYLLKSHGVKRSVAQNDAHSQNDAIFWLYRTGTFYQTVIEIMNNMGNMQYQALTCLNGLNLSDAMGTRLRAGCEIFTLDESSSEPAQVQINRFILEEMASEGAFEGVRYFDLVRFAKRRGYESWLGDIVSQKYPAEQRAAVKARLSNRNYWHFPYYYKNVAKNPNLNQKSGY